MDLGRMYEYRFRDVDPDVLGRFHHVLAPHGRLGKQFLVVGRK